MVLRRRLRAADAAVEFQLPQAFPALQLALRQHPLGRRRRPACRRSRLPLPYCVGAADGAPRPHRPGPRRQRRQGQHRPARLPVPAQRGNQIPDGGVHGLLLLCRRRRHPHLRRAADHAVAASPVGDNGHRARGHRLHLPALPGYAQGHGSRHRHPGHVYNAVLACAARLPAADVRCLLLHPAGGRGLYDKQPGRRAPHGGGPVVRAVDMLRTLPQEKGHL